MVSIVDLGLASFDRLSAGLTQEFENMSAASKPIRDAMLSLDLVRKVSTEDSTPVSVVTVDGACITQQLAGIDLLDACAVASEGITGKRLWTSEDDIPAIYWADYIKDHSSAFSDAANSLMCAQEMMLLEHSFVQAHDLQIIDGSWTSALISVMIMLQRQTSAAQIFNNFLTDWIENGNGDNGYELISNIKRRNVPGDFASMREDADKKILVAVSKSDSQKSYASFLKQAGIDHPMLKTMGDRTLSSTTLEPGEMLPVIDMPFRVPNFKESSYNATDFAGVLAAKKSGQYDVLKDFYDALPEVLDNTGISIAPRGVLESLVKERWLHTTYFKPVHGQTSDRPLKVDFVRPEDLSPEDPNFNTEISEYAQSVVLSALSQDIVPDLSKEPMSQYQADLEAKKISVVAKTRRSYFANTLENPQALSAIMSTYRT